MKFKVVIIFLALFSAGLFISCAKKVNYKKSSVQITGHGSDMESIKCKFSPPFEMIERFFELAKEISPKEEHQTYGWSPCYTEGNVEWMDEKWTFKLRPSGSANIQNAKGDFKLLGCAECAASLKSYEK